MKIEFQYTLDDALDASRTHRRLWLKKDGLILIVVLLSLTVLVPSLLKLLFGLSLLSGMISTATVGTFLFFLLWQGIVSKAKEVWTSATWVRGPFAVEITDDGVFIRSPRTDLRLEWNVFDLYLESSNLFVLGKPHLVVGLPKRAFNEGQLAEMRALLAAKIPAKGN